MNRHKLASFAAFFAIIGTWCATNVVMGDQWVTSAICATWNCDGTFNCAADGVEGTGTVTCDVTNSLTNPYICVGPYPPNHECKRLTDAPWEHCNGLYATDTGFAACTCYWRRCHSTIIY